MVKRNLLFLVMAGIGVAGCDQYWTGRTQPIETVGIPGELGSRLPQFRVKDLQGRDLSSVDLRGKVVLIDFWATWCQPCAKEMPGYQELLNRYAPRGFVVIGLKLDTMSDTEEPLLFARKLGVNYPLVVGGSDLRQKFGGIEGLPTTLLYDRQGIMRKKVVGFEYASAFETDLKSLL